MALDTTYGTLNETALESDGGDHTIDYAYFTHLHHYQTRQIKIKSYVKMHIKFISIRILLSLELTITLLDRSRTTSITLPRRSDLRKMLLFKELEANY
jgi:hypothetical protein